MTHSCCCCCCRRRCLGPGALCCAAQTTIIGAAAGTAFKGKGSPVPIGAAAAAAVVGVWPGGAQQSLVGCSQGLAARGWHALDMLLMLHHHCRAEGKQGQQHGCVSSHTLPETQSNCTMPR
jgi:hypothetical protein